MSLSEQLSEMHTSKIFYLFEAPSEFKQFSKLLGLLKVGMQTEINTYLKNRVADN